MLHKRWWDSLEKPYGHRYFRSYRRWCLSSTVLSGERHASPHHRLSSKCTAKRQQNFDRSPTFIDQFAQNIRRYVHGVHRSLKCSRLVDLDMKM
ncbi:hypothetical protein U1Q18_016736 [Sarracenia purpurea var. burkii]